MWITKQTYPQKMWISRRQISDSVVDNVDKLSTQIVDKSVSLLYKAVVCGPMWKCG